MSRNNEPAFPFEYEGDGGQRVNHVGMSLRDWFAGQAIAGGVLNVTGSPDRMANYAYQIADAMMKERDQ